MKKPTKYTNEPMEARVITDFLPPPRKLRLKHSPIPLEPEIWTKGDGEQFVILSLADFVKVQHLIKNAGLLSMSRTAKRREANVPKVSLSEVRRQPAVPPAMRTRKAR